MSEIHFSLAGEGRGHATRARTLVEELRKQHRVTIHTFGDAYQMLRGPYAGTDVRVVEIPGARFHYDVRGRLDLVRTAVGNIGVVGGARAWIDRLARRLEADGADLVLTDFEPLLPRAARRVGLPTIAIDHQSVFSHGDLCQLPAALRRHARMIGRFVKAWVPTPDLQISSSFYSPAPIDPLASVRFVGVLLRRAVRETLPSTGEHVVVYLRRHVTPAFLESLAAAGAPVRLYGPKDTPVPAGVELLEIDERRFVADLASCRALVTTAGNQLVGEALYFGKPVLALPEPGNREQEINAWFLQQTGAGRSMSFDSFDASSMESFLGERDELAQRAVRQRVDGTSETLELVEGALTAA